MEPTRHTQTRSPHEKELTPKFRVVTPLAAISLAFVFVVILAVILWAFLGEIPIVIKGDGIIVSKEGLFVIESNIAGTVNKIFVKMNDKIKKGDLVALIYDPQLDLKLHDSKIRVQGLTAQLDALKKQIKVERDARDKALRIKIKGNEFAIKKLNDQMTLFEKELDERKELLSEGLISGNNYQKAVQEYIQGKIELEKLVGQQAELKAEIAQEFRPEEVRTLQQKLTEEKNTLNILEASVEHGKVYSSYDGKVLGLMANIGDYVKIGQPLIWCEKLDREKKSQPIIYGYFSIAEGKKIKPGMPAQVTVQTVNSNEYGAIEGTVTSVSNFAVSADDVQNEIQNQAIVDNLIQQSASIQVNIQPKYNPENPDGFLWTSHRNPPIPVSTGTVGIIEVTTQESRPIYYIIPLPQFKNFAFYTEKEK